MKAQASFEYIILIGTLLILVVPIFYYVTYQSSQNLKAYQADDAVKSIARTVDTVYAIGPGTKNYVWVTFPGGIQNTSISNNEIIIRISSYGGETDIIAKTRAKVIGNITAQKGTYKISIEMLDSGEVKIG